MPHGHKVAYRLYVYLSLWAGWLALSWGLAWLLELSRGWVWPCAFVFISKFKLHFYLNQCLWLCGNNINTSHIIFPRSVICYHDSWTWNVSVCQFESTIIIYLHCIYTCVALYRIQTTRIHFVHINRWSHLLTKWTVRRNGWICNRFTSLHLILP